MQHIDTEFRSSMGLRLREERVRLGFSQSKLAELGNTKMRTLQDWERGIAAVHADFLASVIAHGVDVLYVLTGKRGPAAGELSPGPREWLDLDFDEVAVLNFYRKADDQSRAAVKAVLEAFASLSPRK